MIAANSSRLISPSWSASNSSIIACGGMARHGLPCGHRPQDCWVAGASCLELVVWQRLAELLRNAPHITQRYAAGALLVVAAVAASRTIAARL